MFVESWIISFCGLLFGGFIVAITVSLYKMGVGRFIRNKQIGTLPPRSTESAL
jgi:hypothetical protein